MSVVLARTSSAIKQPSADDYDNGQAQCQFKPNANWSFLRWRPTRRLRIFAPLEVPHLAKSDP
jgi:hypothetical protein